MAKRSTTSDRDSPAVSQGLTSPHYRLGTGPRTPSRPAAAAAPTGIHGCKRPPSSEQRLRTCRSECAHTWSCCNSMEHQNGSPLPGPVSAGAHGATARRISRRQVTGPLEVPVPLDPSVNLVLQSHCQYAVTWRVRYAREHRDGPSELRGPIAVTKGPDHLVLSRNVVLFGRDLFAPSYGGGSDQIFPRGPQRSKS